MENALRTSERSTLEYSAMKLRDLPDKMFTKDYLKDSSDQTHCQLTPTNRCRSMLSTRRCYSLDRA